MKKRASIVAAILLAILGGCGKDGTGGKSGEVFRETVTTGIAAADFAARNRENRYVTLSGFRGRVVLLTFWRKKCPECLKTLDTMERLYRKFRNRGFVVLALNGDNLDYVPSSRIWKLVEEKGYTFPVLLDDRYLATERYRVIRIPATFLIDDKGVISYVKYGEDDWMSKENIERIGKLLQSPG